MHDYFEILGVSRDARPSEIRRACCRRARATHPDIRVGEAVSPMARPHGPSGRRADRFSMTPDLCDAAIDFVDAAAFVDGMRAGFFAERQRQKA